MCFITENVVKIDGFDKAIIGVTHDNKLIYEYDIMVAILCEKQNITKEMIDKIHDIEHRSFNPTFKEIHATYENGILEALNVKETGYSLTLKKKDE